MNKTNRFIFYTHAPSNLERLVEPDWLADEELTAEPSPEQSVKLALIQDYNWYAENQDEVEAWAKHSLVNFRRRGMILFFQSEEDRGLFAIRWG